MNIIAYLGTEEQMNSYFNHIEIEDQRTYDESQEDEDLDEK